MDDFENHWQILQDRIKRGAWPLHKLSNYRKQLSADDRIIFFLGKPKFIFVGTAVLASEFITAPEKERHLHIDRGRFTGEIIRLKDAELWKAYVPVRSVIESLKAFPRKEHWGAYLQGGVTPLPEGDYDTIINADKSAKDKKPSPLR